MARIVFTTFGSLGDVYPYLAIALGLRERGHDVVLATGTCYRQMIESTGLRFHAVRPDSDWLSDPDKVRRLSHPRLGLLRVGRELLNDSHISQRATEVGERIQRENGVEAACDALERVRRK